MVERLEHVLRLAVERDGPATPIGEAAVRAVGREALDGQRIVRGDDLRRDADRGQEQGNGDAGPVDAGRAADDRREAVGLEERAGDSGERRRARIEHVAVRGRDPVRDRLVGHQRHVPVADLVRIAEDAGSPLHLVGPADVDHLANPKVVQRLLRGDRELVEGIGPEERPPAGLPAVAGRVAADVAQVARPGEAEMALSERGSVGNVGGHEPEATAPDAGATEGAAEPPRLLREAGGPAMERARLEPGPRNCSKELFLDGLAGRADDVPDVSLALAVDVAGGGIVREVVERPRSSLDLHGRRCGRPS